MSIITLYLQREKEAHIFELPQYGDEFERNLELAGALLDGSPKYSYSHIKSDLLAVQDRLQGTDADIREINTLAQILDRYDDDQQEQYEQVLEDCKYNKVFEMISLAEHFDEFDIKPEIGDNAELGQWYVEKEYPDLDGIICDNLDYDGVGASVLRYEDGKLTDAGYITNYDVVMNQVNADIRRYYEKVNDDRTAQNASETKIPDCVRQITAAELRTLPVQEGLIIQGCGGDLKEWVDGINETLTEAGILQEGDKFTDVYAFEYDGLTNMLFSMDDIKLDIGKMAMWRLQSHASFGGTWLSDYVPNRLGVERAPEETGGMQMGGME